MIQIIEDMARATVTGRETCSSCGGNGWKFLTTRSSAARCGDAGERAWQRRARAACLACDGSGLPPASHAERHPCGVHCPASHELRHDRCSCLPARQVHRFRSEDVLLNAPSASPADAVARLDALAIALSAHGWTARVYAPRGRIPSLHARNPEPGATALSEHIYAQPHGDGTWTYWWPWAEPIADSPAHAAAIIVRVLRPADA